MLCCLAIDSTCWTKPTIDWYSLSASPRVALNCSWASNNPWISSIVWTMNISTKSSRAPSSQLLNGCNQYLKTWDEFLEISSIVGSLQQLSWQTPNEADQSFQALVRPPPKLDGVTESTILTDPTGRRWADSGRWRWPCHDNPAHWNNPTRNQYGQP